MPAAGGASAGVPAAVIGTTGGSRLDGRVDGAAGDRRARSPKRRRIWATALERLLRAAGAQRRIGAQPGSLRSTTDARQVQGRVRRLRHLRASRGGEPHLPRALRAAASRAGERRHRRRRRRPRCASREAMGHVADAFDEATLDDAARALAIGHTRYSTAGESKLKNAQPILIDCAHGQIAVAHNGNLVNAQRAARRSRARRLDLPDQQRHRGLLHLYARSRAPTVEDALVESISQVRGAFSLVLLTKDRLIAARDPHGFRPLALGQARRRLDRLLGDVRARSDRRDLRARRRAGRGAGHQPTAGCARSSRSRRRRWRTASSSTSTSRGPTATCSASSVNEVRTELGRMLARESPVDADVVVPIPDSGVCAAIGYAEAGRHADADGADPQSLRRPDVHRAAAVDPPLRRQGEAQSGAQHPRRAAASS